MPNGRLSAHWENKFSPDEIPQYRCNFAERRGEHGAQTSLRFSGKDALRDYFVAVQEPTMMTESREDRARKWLLELHSSSGGSIAKDQIDLTEEQAKKYRRKN